MQPAYRIDAHQGYLVGPPTDEAIRELQIHRPPRLELVGERHDLRPYGVVRDAVRVLSIAGSIESGRIASLDGFDALAHIEVLEIAGKVKGGFDASALHSLCKVDLHWQPSVNDVLALSSLEHVTVRGYAGTDLTALRASPSVESLWLATPAVQELTGLEAFTGLARLRLSRARRLQSLQGVQHPALRVLEIDDARALTDLSALADAGLERLALVSIAASASLEPLSRLPMLRELVVGGTNAPDIDWRAVLALPRLCKVAAMWDPVGHPEQALRAAVPAGRSITRFDPIPGTERRALVVELA